ncbi:MAG: LuxR C-terminal-related transcriptional regulator [Eggerthellaceae bacterium]|nr:LuxR C-terminal-related transcriptional regulator [Eggerthellaceae bacterium]
MAQPKQNTPNTTPKTPEAMMLIASFGFSCYILWEIIGMFEMLPYLPSHLDFELLLFQRPLGFFALAVSFLGALGASRFLIKHLDILMTIAALSSFLTLISSMLATFFVSSSLFSSALAWVFFGISLSSTMLLWAVFFSSFYTPSLHYVMLIGFTAAIVVFLGLSFTGALQHLYVFIGFLLITTTLAISGFFLYSLTSVLKENTGKPKPMRPAVMLHSGAYGIVYGFSLAFLVMLGENASFIAAGSALVGCVAAWLIARKRKIYDNIYIRRITFAPVVVALIFIPIGGNASYMICSFLIISACFCTALTSWIITAEAASRLHLNPVAIFTNYKFSSWTGIFVGMAIGSFVILTGEESFSLVVTVMTALICLTFAVLELSMERNAKNQDAANDKITRYRKCCQEVAQQYSLSARELEVLYFLAKGRNAEYIALELYIAKPTVKTHIQHIYQKTNVNSQQALIDVVEHQGKPV